MGASDHVQVFQSVVLLAEADGDLDKGACAAKLLWVARLLPVHDDSDRLIRLHLLWFVKRASSVREDDLLLRSKRRVFYLFSFFVGGGEEGLFIEVVDLIGIGVGYPEYVLV